MRELSKVIRHIDHVTYAGKHENESVFLSHWQKFGFKELQRLYTQRFPATHIALVSGWNPEFPWETMTGLSVSPDLQSPINRFIERYGEGIQHVAYNISPDIDMTGLQRSMEKTGWKFMTPVLTYEDNAHALLKQLFIAPEAPYGTFVELVQRLPNSEGQPYNSFDIQNIDDLYQSYSDYSQWLLTHGKAA